MHLTQYYSLKQDTSYSTKKLAASLRFWSAVRVALASSWVCSLVCLVPWMHSLKSMLCHLASSICPANVYFPTSTGEATLGEEDGDKGSKLSRMKVQIKIEKPGGRQEVKVAKQSLPRNKRVNTGNHQCSEAAPTK